MTSKLRTRGLTIDDPLAPTPRPPDPADPPPSRAMAGDERPRHADPKPSAKHRPRRGARAAAMPPSGGTTPAPAGSGVQRRSWTGLTRVASYRLPDELLVELAKAANDLRLPIGLMVTAAITQLLDQPPPTIAELVDRAEDARIHGRRTARRDVTVSHATGAEAR